MSQTHQPHNQVQYREYDVILTKQPPQTYLETSILDIPCKHTARYVIVETTYDAPDDGLYTGAMLEICEIEVYGIKDLFIFSFQYLT